MLSQINLVEKVLLTFKLPEGVELYDFGGGNFIAPEFPTDNDAPYLKSHMVAVMRTRNSKDDPIIITAFPFDLQFVTPKELELGLFEAAKQNLTQTKTNSVVRTEKTQ